MNKLHFFLIFILEIFWSACAGLITWLATHSRLYVMIAMGATAAFVFVILVIGFSLAIASKMAGDNPA